MFSVLRKIKRDEDYTIVGCETGYFGDGDRRYITVTVKQDIEVIDYVFRHKRDGVYVFFCYEKRDE